MALEIETKLKVESHEPLRRLLRLLGATTTGTCLETNLIFDTPDRSLLRRDVGLRVRTCRFEDGRPQKSTMTVKGPALHGPLKSREELEFAIEDPQAAETAFRMLGFLRSLGFVKRRESYVLSECRIELDTLPLVGTYVEIEALSAQAVLAAQAALELGALPHEPRSYAALLAEACALGGHDASNLGM